MLKTILELPDGTEISSGVGMINAIKSATITECVNDSEELRLGSTCASALEVTLFTPAGTLELVAGAEVVVHKESEGVRRQVGVFILEKPTRPSANTMKVTGYDRVSQLDKDLTAWLAGLTEWPYTLTTFAGMVCEACGLTFKGTDMPNGDFLVQKFSRSSVTGRQIMRWLGEICCRFCHATPEGEIEFAWYTDSGKSITPGGEAYYFQNSLTYEDYVTAEIEAVQIRLADSENGALWPADAEEFNRYIITGNAILNTKISEELLPVLENIKNALAGVQYTPCKVSVPANLDIRVGNTISVTDKNGKTFTAYVMTKTQAGQKDTLECTGSYRRNTTASTNNKTQDEIAADAVNAQTQKDIFARLTNNGQEQGIYLEDGKVYINLSYVKAGEISVESEAFLEPGMQEYEEIKKHLQRTEIIPDEKLWLYDFNEDGIVDITDSVYVQRAIRGDYAIGNHWQKAEKSKLTVSIKPSDANKTICITGTNMWGRNVEVVIGVNPQFSAFATKEYVAYAIETALESIQ